MRQTRQFHQHKQTKAQNRTAFAMWLNGCSDDALAGCDILSLSRSYGLPIEDVNSAVLRQRLVRSGR